MEQRDFDNIFFLVRNNLEIHAICSIINKIYSNKRTAPNNKWKILTPLKFFYSSNSSLRVPPHIAKQKTKYIYTKKIVQVMEFITKNNMF